MSDINHFKRVDELREDIDRVLAELAWTGNSPMPKADWKQRVSRWIKGHAADSSTQLGALRAMRSAKGGDQQFISETLMVSKGKTFVRAQSEPQLITMDQRLAPTLCWLMGDELERRLHAKIDADDYVPGPAMADRPDLEKILKIELCRLELQEEAVIFEAEAEHVFIGRRKDADPAVVLEYSPDGAMGMPEIGGRVGVPTVVSQPAMSGGDPYMPNML